MALYCQFSGNPSTDNSRVDAVLQAKYGSGLTMHHVNLHRSAAGVFTVISATSTRPSGGAYKRGDKSKSPIREEISAEVRQVLRLAGIPISE